MMTTSPFRAAPTDAPASGAEPRHDAATDTDAAHAEGPDGRRWLRALAPYREAKPTRGLIELAVTLAPFAALWALMLLTVEHAYWLTLLLAVPAAGLLVRLFMIQHDCGHGSFFRRRAANDWLGRAISVLTFTPYGYWRQAHAIHHGTSGHLDRRGTGDIDTLTVREFEALPLRRRLLYRLFRSPFVLLVVGPPYLFILQQRLPTGFMRSREAWLSVIGTNLGIAALVGVAAATVGLRDFLFIQLPITCLASSIGVWLFYVQHQFEDAYWERQGAWSLHDGALAGSSHLDLPPVLRWFSANIGVHHVHHLSSRIPSYRLGEVLRDHPELRDLNRMTIKDTFGCFRLALWDEDRGRMVSFRQAAAMARRGRGGAEGEPRTESFGLPTAAPPLPAGSTG